MSGKTPHCIGMIMDGNRRWARERGLPTLEGHKKGLANFGQMVQWVRDAGAKHVVVYALSTENWNRNKEELSYLMTLFQTAISDAFKRVQKEGIRLHFVGDLSRFPEKLQKNFVRLEKESESNDDFHAWICVSYGGRLEITQAAKTLSEGGKEITENSLRGAMWSAGMPDPDIIIRTGGEKRLSNFCLWQAAYSELFFSDTYWPEFTQDELRDILKEYAQRERRYGT